MFTVVTAMFGLLLVLTLRFGLSVAEARQYLISFLVFYAIGVFLLINTAYLGGQLVLEFGLGLNPEGAYPLRCLHFLV